MPEIIEISGLDDGIGQDKTDPSPVISIGLLVGSIFLLAVIPKIIQSLRGQGRGDDLSGLGIIRPCRRSDLVSGKPRRSQKWCLWDSKGRRVLGRHSRRSGALRQERAIQVRKHR